MDATYLSRFSEHDKVGCGPSDFSFENSKILRYKITISAQMTKMITNRANSILRKSKVKGQKLVP